MTGESLPWLPGFAGLVLGVILGLAGRPAWRWARRRLSRRSRHLVRLGVRRRRAAGKKGAGNESR